MEIFDSKSNQAVVPVASRCVCSPNGISNCFHRKNQAEGQHTQCFCTYSGLIITLVAPIHAAEQRLLPIC